MAHNEPVEHAQKSTGVVTAGQLLAVVRKGSTFSIHGRAALDRASYSDSFVFEFTAIDRAFTGRNETRTSVEVPGYVSNGHTSEAETRTGYDGRKYVHYVGTHRPMAGHWYLGHHGDTLRDILEVLPKDAEVSLHVYLDGGTNGYLVNASVLGPDVPTEKGLHSDLLYLEASYMVWGKRKVRKYLVDTTCGAHNSARFGYNR